MALIDLSEKFREIRNSVEKVNFTDVRLTEKFKKEYELYLSENRANGYSNVEWAEFSTKITTSTGKAIFITNFWFYIAAELSNYLDGLSQQKDIFKDIYKNTDLQKAAVALRDGISEQEKSKIESYFTSKNYTKNDLECFFSFVSDYKSWGGGKTIDRNDYYVSPLLQAGNLLAETQSAVAEIAKQMSENPTLKNSFKPIFIPKVQKSTETLLSSGSRGGFAYSLVSFLIKNKIEKPFWECLVEKNREQGNFNIEHLDFRLTSIFKVAESELDKPALERGDKLRFFEKPFLVNSKYYYLSNQWTDGTDSRLDIENLKNIFHALYPDYEIKTFESEYFLTKKEKNSKFIGSTLSKPFLLLAGISGTGKTRFVREQAKTSEQFAETYCLTSVRPDWHEPSDLLGYISRLNGDAEYITTDVLQFIAKAWRAIAHSDLKVEVQDNKELGERLVVTGERAALAQVLPYWLCLDEMNLAPVEQYFADYLSVLETREWDWTSDSFTYSSDALLKPATIKAVADKEKLRKELGFGSAEDGKYNELWALICQYGLGIPFNLLVAGTVNMDETTHGFSRKVIDRALSFDFGEFFPNDYNDFFTPTSCNKRLSYPIWSHANKAELVNTFDADGVKTVAFLSAVNTVLKNTPFELAFRALNELILAVASSQPQDDLTLKAVWDDFMMCKVLPRIEGDEDKLAGHSDKNILEALLTVLEQQLAGAWENGRPDLYREKLQPKGETINVDCRSKKKLNWMNEQLVRGFTSFWP
ncbi:5-methylcytosine-specific restriction endonuclease McrBC, GTP-binding regulatory subunit McrB [Colwellia chukchiensis]|uniref:5-methylcytosine-specific restriction endonuclease McrBC, GTP-binding regulatory subunit McrB n=1 Tax=Colwellia chukchiensis TaxID=641665 RepID=A0A1H7PW81_9GAMM|nr:restriction endonuclease [Colwellia chukchiensis]SEL39992.1 5-methylcytosine-specific restriction endonuclease McrBC, GTP-binding regulatory subunit McrB [Colwellia chukchiensis]